MISYGDLLSLFCVRNAGIGVQEWGLVFQCLYLVSNQRALTSTNGMWLYILSDKCFPEMILRFISGTGMNIQKNNVASVSIVWVLCGNTVSEKQLIIIENRKNYVQEFSRTILKLMNLNFLNFACAKT